jgi:F-type H+-transporting ATPase subunit a
MRISPDQLVVFELSFEGVGTIPVNATIVFTWVVMALLVVGARLITMRISSQLVPSGAQNFLEVLIEGLNTQIREVSQQRAAPYLAFIGTLFLFIATSNLLAIVPGFTPPTGSLSTTTALALCVLVAVPIYGISRRGALAYARNYLRPTPLMLPFNIISEISRTIALAIRLYGNVMSGTVVVAILISIVPFFFPILLQLLGLLTGMIQAYIFAVLATVYIASATAPRAGDNASVGAAHSTSPGSAEE